MLSHKLLITLALVAPALGHPVRGDPPAVYKRSGDSGAWHDADEQLTVYDPAVTAATSMPGLVAVAGADGSPVATRTETIVVLPASLSSAAPTSPPTNQPATTTTTMTTSSVKTVVAPPAQTGSPSHGGSSPPKKPGKGVGNIKGLGISYAPYRADHSCKSSDEVMNDFLRLKGEYAVVRTYGTDCDQVPIVYKAAKEIGSKMMLGIWDINSVDAEADLIVDGVGGDWGRIHSISVGNELVNNGQASASQVSQAVSRARSKLRGAGYKGPVVAVDTFMAAQSYPELCESSDYCAINAHPFFDSTATPGDSGRWLRKTIQNVKSCLSKDMDIVITETGWPTDGAQNGKAIPSLENQKVALEAIRDAFADDPGSIILFSAFDDLWKTKTMATFNADQHWGIGGAVSVSDLGLI